jgi:hypothetical protein
VKPVAGNVKKALPEPVELDVLAGSKLVKASL